MSAFTRQEITQIFKKARRVLRHPGLDILAYPKTQPEARILVVTSRKVGNAPQRNKMRRRLKAIFFEAQLFNNPYDIVVVAKLGGAQLSFDELKALLLDTLSHA